MRIPTSTTLAWAAWLVSIRYLEVAAYLFQRQAAQAVVAAELDDDHCRFVQFQGTRQPAARAAGGFAADTGVDYAVPVTLPGQSLFQQGHPGGIHFDAIAGAQAVAEHQDGVGRGRGVNQTG